ncbi:MAG: hypothetical protein U0270_22010 [Labilithrix sp.]
MSFALLLALLALLVPVRADATGALLPLAGWSAPAVSVRMAVALGPSGATTRWSEVTLPAGPAVGWLVPIRPGATVEWAPNAWLDALDLASAPRVLVPRIAAPCALHQSFDLPPPWVRPANRLPAGAIALPATSADAEAWAEGHGLIIDAARLRALRALYTSGWRVAAVELFAFDRPRTSPTLRATDDGGATAPLFIGAPAAETAVTLMIVGAGHASIADMREISDSALRWGAKGSSYAELRQVTLGHEGWLRESASHAALFDEVKVGVNASIRPVTTAYFDDRTCAANVQSRGSATAPQDAAHLTCGTRTDLALALARIAPADAVLTRLAGVLPAQEAAGVSIEVAAGTDRSPVRSAASFAGDPCPAGGVDVTLGDDDDSSPSSSSSGYSSSGYSSSGYSSSGYSPGSSGTYTEGSTTVYVPSDGCGSSSTTVIEEDDDDDWTYGDDDDDDTSSSSDGWDSSDSSDDCSGDTSSSSDGWDSSDDSTCAIARPKKRRGPSPLSRVILIAVAMLLPLRRLARPRSGVRS